MDKFQDAFAAYDEGFQSIEKEKSDRYKEVEAKYQKFLKTTMNEIGSSQGNFLLKRIRALMMQLLELELVMTHLHLHLFF